MNLENEFKELWDRMGCKGDWQPAWRERVKRYAEPWRHYHVLSHPGHMIRELKPVLPLLEYPDEAIWAAVDHDVVQVPAIGGTPVVTNELYSAWVAEKTLDDAGIQRVIQVRVVLKIFATDHKPRHMHEDTKYIVDADMAILGQPWRVYENYCEGVMREYVDCGVPTKVFYSGRQVFLQGLQQRKIFHTEHFGSLYEDFAHENIEREFELLTKRLQPI